MDVELDYNSIIKDIQKLTKKNFTCKEINNKPKKSIANFGAKKGDVVKLERNGEYFGIAVEILEDVAPLLTDRLICKILALLKNQDFITVLEILNLTEIDQLFYILYTWVKCATMCTVNYFNKCFKKSYLKFDKWITKVSHDPLDCKIKVVDIGCNKNTGSPVIPPEWLNREFDSGSEMHVEMDKLEWRIGKPPVTYAIIYSMIIQNKQTVLESLQNVKYNKIFFLKLNNNQLKTVISNNPIKGYSYIKCNKNVIGFKLDSLLEVKNKDNNIREVGVLVSRLQKSIRRGRYGYYVLVDTIKKLNDSPNYNLPEHGFMRVSASKQLVWRLFITILEDCRPYICDDQLGLLELIMLTLITQKCTEYKFKKNILDMIIYTACVVQYNDSTLDTISFKKLDEATAIKINEKCDLKMALFLALDNCTMMGGDRSMLLKYYTYNSNLKKLVIPKQWINNKICCLFQDENDKLNQVSNDIILSSFDHHCKPTIILYYQACIEISMTTREISNYIWNVSSSFNVRFNKILKKDKILTKIQKYFYNTTNKITDKKDISVLNSGKIAELKYEIMKQKITTNDKRTSFLLLFGQKYRVDGADVIMCGSDNYPIKIKKNGEWTSSNDINYINKFETKEVSLMNLDPPFGFSWVKKKVTVSIKNSKPHIDGVMIPFFDGSYILRSNNAIIKTPHNDDVNNLILRILCGNAIDFDTLIYLRTNPQYSIKKWNIDTKFKYLNYDLIKLVYTKIFNQFENNITIGPVERSGSKMHNSINYLLEGKIWAVFNLLYYLYPITFKLNGLLSFKINKNTYGYTHLVDNLRKIIFKKVNVSGVVPIIKTKLWDHQIDSVKKITSGFINGVHGFGNASDVGSGKTLNALAIGCKMIEIGDNYHYGVLVLLPNNKLIKTWKDEIEKHTRNFDVIYQENSAEIGIIKKNTIVITTMGRIRDHPIRHKWLLLVIDECLSVQNKNALQTEEAWTQSLLSKHIIMMSATFFRARFDKLYYMLKMLQTGLPEKREYLDTILVETMISEISLLKRKWVSNINRFKLDKKLQIKYSKLDMVEMDNEARFSKLSSFLISNNEVQKFVVIKLALLIKSMEKESRRCLIYARSKNEADAWSSYLKIKQYPEKGNHCIVTYNDGTYGLNDLVMYNCIITRPPNSDIIPQIKGRLDRPGQKLNTLHIEYFIIQQTIEEGLILRMNIASQFLHKYIMPLAKFYDISLNYKKYSDIN